MTLAAYEETKKSGFYDKNPAREIPIKQMLGKAPTENSKGVRLVNLPQVRDIENEEFEKMLAGEQTAQQALDNAVSRGNAAIQQALGELRLARRRRASERVARCSLSAAPTGRGRGAMRGKRSPHPLLRGDVRQDEWQLASVDPPLKVSVEPH